MNDNWIIPENKCVDCRHKLRTYCKAYKVDINLIDISKCKRKKFK
ncbi:hypothetical protein LCGC14_0225020 [marine sediment metagenome]|uniref:Uncharacterized protein n=1 Tax=marine sediment metagenome TaxID=412755 RepID=A0A0F9XG90_9ZZZZ